MDVAGSLAPDGSAVDLDATEVSPIRTRRKSGNVRHYGRTSRLGEIIMAAAKLYKYGGDLDENDLT